MQEKKVPSLNPVYRGATPEDVALALLWSGRKKAQRRHRRRMRWLRFLRIFGLEVK